MALRLRLARFALWRLKHGSSVVPTLLLLTLIGGSGVLGYSMAMHQQWLVSSAQAQGPVPQLAAAEVRERVADSQSEWLLAQELGRIQAEIVSLRVLFLRLAEVAKLEDGEFDLDMDFSPLQPEWPAESELKGPLGAELKVKSLRKDDSETSQLWRHDEPSTMSAGQARAMLASREASMPLVKQSLVHISDQAARLESVYRERRLAHDFRVSGLPVGEAHISSRYGYRVNPLTGRRQLHQGLDLAGKPGSRIMALADGIVTYSGRNGGYGNLVELEHPGGYRTRYAHNHSILVPLGARVSKGQTIATMGSTGRSTGTHLHVEVRQNGRSLDPQLYIR